MEIAYLLTGMWALWLTYSSFRIAVRKRAFDTTALYFATLVILPSLSGAVAQFTGGRAVSMGLGASSTVVMSGIATLIAQFTPVLIAVAASLYSLSLMRERIRLNIASLILSAVFLTGAFGALSANQNLPGGQSFVTYLAFIPLLFTARKRSSLIGAAHALAVLISLSGIAAIVSPASVMMECSDRKCGALGHLFAGISTNFNSFGMLMALAVPVVYLGLKRHNLQMSAIAAIYGILSESRTSQVAIILSITLIAVHAYRTQKKTRRAGLVIISSVAFPVIVAASAPFIGLPPETFTGRAGLWDLARWHVQDSLIVGLGPDTWSALQNTGEIRRAAAYSAHNQVMDIVFISGISGFLFFVIFVAYTTWLNRTHMASFLLLMAPVAILAITERPWSVGRFDWLSWSLFLTAIVCFGTRNRDIERKHERAPSTYMPANS